MILTPKNWKSFQHYKDRAPLWIKLHRGLLDNIDYHLLTPLAGKCLPLIWLIASEKDGSLPGADELAFRLRISASEAGDILEQLTCRGFLIEAQEAAPAEHGATLAQTIAANNGFGSRHISDATKRAAWDRDGGKCKKCASIENIEYDHVHPVSKGGNSDLENIQLLCRPCNRSKRVSIATQAQPQGSDSRSLEKRDIDKRTIIEETDSVAIAPRTRSADKIPKKVSRPLPEGYLLPDEVNARALELGLSGSEVSREHIKFCNHAKQTDRRCADWLPAEETWMIGAAERLGKSPPSNLSELQNWEVIVETFKKTGHWSKWANSPEPGMIGCRCPAEILRKHGIGFGTQVGETMQ